MSPSQAAPAPRTIEPLVAPPDAVVAVPGSKSHTNRALVCAALAAGTSRLDGALFANDTLAMVGALDGLGIAVRADAEAAVMEVDGCGGALPPGPLSLDVAQSGTTSRFVLAVLALGPGPYLLDGDPQLRARPFGPLAAALRRLGATIEGDALPLRVAGPPLRSGAVSVPGSASSQFLSGLLLAAPYARSEGSPIADGASPEGRPGPAMTITVEGELVSRPYVELTIDTMAAFGVEVEADGDRFVVPSATYRPAEVAIEPDASAATYFFAAAAITGGRVRVPGLGRRTVQGDLGFVDVLERMGATVNRGDDWTEVIGPERLVGVEVDMADMSDAAQTLAVVAAFADGPTRVTGIGFIELKETRRVSAVVAEMQRLGIEATVDDDGFTINPGAPRPGTVHTYDDHRMAMSFALLGLRHPGITLDDADCVSKTFPRYFEVLDTLRG
ncbi:MAG: 3-phosphoshikimate 1-carboxyvinyltransferase [Actinomycetota bacterium]